MLAALYNDPAYFTDQETAAAERDARRKLNVILPLLPPRAQILDFGCGAGAFLRESIRSGLQPQGHDVSPYAAERARNIAGCPVRYGSLSSVHVQHHAFDAITAFDVIEHLTEWESALTAWSRWIKPSGILALTTPNLRSWDARLLGRHWYGFRKIPEHVNYFTPQSITRALAVHGFIVERIAQWGFVRPLGFIVDRIALPGVLGHALRTVVHGSPLQSMTPYIPMVDMLVIARAV